MIAMSTELVIQAGRLRLVPWNPHGQMLVILQLGKQRERNSPGHHWPAILAYLGSCRLMRDPISKNKADNDLGMSAKAVLWLPHTSLQKSM